jgi:hypothetical protein
MIEQREIVDDAGAAPVKRHAVGLAGLVQVELDIDIAMRRAQRRQLMQQAPLVLARLDGVLLARKPIDNADAHPGVTNPIAQFRCEVPLDLFT